MKEIKFRAWDGKKMQLAFDLSQDPKYWRNGNKDYPIMQYVGLKDKNGIDGYFDDIIKFDNPNPPVFSKIKYLIGYIGYNKYGQSCVWCNDKEYHIDRIIQGEIIGNKRQNSELLIVNSVNLYI